LLAVVYVNWSVLAGQTLGQWGPKFLIFSQLSLRLGILITVLWAVWRNFFFFFFLRRLRILFVPFGHLDCIYIYIYRSGYIVVK
jgi:hypothetical protein